MILFWQFTIKSLGELDIVSNQHLSIEMFLIRLIYLHTFKPQNENKNDNKNINNQESSNKEEITSKMINNETINQIKTVSQEKKVKLQAQLDTKVISEIKIESFTELLSICLEKKEIKLKYELEKNVNVVKFENGRIEISFNDNLDKDFVKELSAKLLEWTNQRWIISFSKQQGEMSIKEKKASIQNETVENAKKSDLYKTMLDHFADAELLDVKQLKKDGE